MITSQHLREAYLSPQMKRYFDRKLAPVPSAEVYVRIEELLKFLNMAEPCPGGIPVSAEIDDVWHYWILETAEYARLCAKLGPGVFLHHSSTDYSEDADVSAKGTKADLESGLSTLVSYVKNYGTFEQDRVRYWPLAARLMDLKKCDLAQFNTWLEAAVRPRGHE
jgi:hypothetical protein